MKSLFLSPAKTPAEVEDALGKLLPGQSRPWLLRSADDDPIAYFNLRADGLVQADISGRHFNEDAAVMSVLERLRALVGGEICDDS